jgi:uncharacterized iron-regulated membrane protein
MMPLVANLLHHPRKLWIRRALFQIHLWVGVLLSLYIVVIALSGSILVFKDELTATTLPAGLSHFDKQRTATIPQVMMRFAAAYPDAKARTITMPTATIPAFHVKATGADGRSFELVADPQTGSLHPIGRTWVGWVRDLHVNLLLGRSYGVQVNAVGAAMLMLLALSGIALWWPGIHTWTRGLRLNFRANWRRVNFDIHNAVGFWALAIIFWWAFSGFYFGFYKQVGAVVNAVSPLRNMISPKSLPTSGSTARVPLELVLQAATSASPAGHLYSLSNPSLAGSVAFASMDLGRPGDSSHRDIVTIDTSSARVLSVWHYGANRSLGDWIMWSMRPLHFGLLWGLPMKILWCFLGLSLAVLSVTGLLMYWNRWLGHRWRSLRQRNTA